MKALIAITCIAVLGFIGWTLVQQNSTAEYTNDIANKVHANAQVHGVGFDEEAKREGVLCHHTTTFLHDAVFCN